MSAPGIRPVYEGWFSCVIYYPSVEYITPVWSGCWLATWRVHTALLVTVEGLYSKFCFRFKWSPVHGLCFCRFDLRTVRVDFVECLMRFLPTEAEVKLLRQYERDRKPLEALSDEDRFMMQFSRIERLNQRMSIMTFMGNFTDNVQMLTPVRQTGRDRQVKTDRQVCSQTDSCTDRWVNVICLIVLCFLSATPRHYRCFSFY